MIFFALKVKSLKCAIVSVQIWYRDVRSANVMLIRCECDANENDRYLKGKWLVVGTK